MPEGAPKPEANKFRESPKWRELYGNHISHLSKTYRGVNAEGEPVTEDALVQEAEEMADVQYKMFLRQQEMQNRMKEDPRVKARAVQELNIQAKAGNEYAKRALEVIDEKKNK